MWHRSVFFFRDAFFFFSSAPSPHSLARAVPSPVPPEKVFEWFAQREAETSPIDVRGRFANINSTAHSISLSLSLPAARFHFSHLTF
jgi:hypothetical protein